MADVELTVKGIDGVLATLQSLPSEVVSKRGGPVKTALRKAAIVIRNEERRNLERITANATASGVKESTGLLLQNVIASRGKAPNGGNGERYLVRVKRKTYPRKGGKPVTTLKTAQILEYGSEKQAAEPWIRPAFAAKAQEAITVAQVELIKAIERVVRKLAAQNKGR